MGLSHRGHALARIFPILLLVAGVACSSDDGTNPPHLSLNNCTSCHTSSARLLATADVEPPPAEPSGEG
jgi:hypothetical protein